MRWVKKTQKGPSELIQCYMLYRNKYYGINFPTRTSVSENDQKSDPNRDRNCARA